ncbi:hypothetical protein F6R98_21295 [Candidatus Methylospira mobilis]|uniref:Uncharacterized protein n=1 Tax=Candidatus Methylospira mobilis TaxID=1808979 RepID=A0A5Q0BRM5_9GAMM|nr:hypothetical protein [Candidatus Methylospira mobilis]QFY44854.1 hypothetical protein F6R98_21295 [Candidatus Methylospira mobilis]
MSKYHAKTAHTGKQHKQAETASATRQGLLQRPASRVWASVQALIVLAFLGFLLSAMTPVWYAQITEHLKILLSEVTIESGKEQEWKLLPASGKGQPEARKTELLVPPSQFNHRSRQLTLVAPSARSGYIKLIGQCRPSPVSGPWDLDCSGDWAGVSTPEEALPQQARNARERGRFTVVFFKGGREGNVTLIADDGGASQPAPAQRFFLVRGK